MGASTITESTGRPRLTAILLAGFMGFLGGQVLAFLLDALAVGVTHYPGGLAHLSHSSTPPWWSNVLGLLGLWAGFASAIIYATTAGRLRSLAHQWRLRWGDLRYVVLGAGCQLLVDLAYRPFHLQQLDKPVKHLFNAAHGVGFVLLIVMTGLVAPVVEEWFFRGMIFRALREGSNFTNPRVSVAVGVVVSAILFALAHGEPLQFLGLVFLGLVLAVLVERTHRLAPSVVTHVSFNCVAIASLVAQRSGH